MTRAVSTGQPGGELHAHGAVGVAYQGVQGAAWDAVFGEQPGGVPELVAPGGDEVGAGEDGGGLAGHAGGEQGDQPAGDGEQLGDGNGDEAAVEQERDQGAEAHADGAACHQGLPALVAGGGDAVEEEHDFRAFAQNGDADDERHGEEGAAAEGDVAAHGLHFAGHLAAVAGHPDLVPAQHEDGGDQDAGVEDLLAGAVEGVLEGAGEQSEDGGAEDARADAACQPDGAAGDPLGCRHDDADDEAGFEDFAEDDDQACEHVFTVLPAR